MKKYVKKTIVKNKIVLDKVICNMCGEVIINGNTYRSERQDYLAIRKCWGYHSNKDGEKHRIDLCENCYDKLVESLKIPPTI